MRHLASVHSVRQVAADPRGRRRLPRDRRHPDLLLVLPKRQLVTLGEAMLRLSVKPGDRVEDAPAFDVHVDGFEAKVAYAAGRGGVRPGWTSVVPARSLGA